MTGVSVTTSESESRDGQIKVDLDRSLWPLMNLTTDPSYVELRRRHYGQRAFDLQDGEGQPLGYFLRTRLPIRGIPVEFVSPLVGWESTGWLNCDRWGSAEWRRALDRLNETDNWDIFQSL